MLKFVLCVSLLAYSCAASANDWTLLSDTADKKVYFDLSSVKRTGSSIKATVLFDYAAPQRIPLPGATATYQSTIEQLRFYCQENAFMTISSFSYTKPMGEGDSILNAPWPAPPSLIGPATNNKVVAEKLCPNPSAIPEETKQDVVYIGIGEFLKQYMADEAVTAELNKKVDLRAYGYLESFSKGDMNNASLVLTAPNRSYDPHKGAGSPPYVTAHMFLSGGQASTAGKIENLHHVMLSCKRYDYKDGTLTGYECSIAEHS